MHGILNIPDSIVLASDRCLTSVPLSPSAGFPPECAHLKGDIGAQAAWGAILHMVNSLWLQYEVGFKGWVCRAVDGVVGSTRVCSVGQAI